MKSNKKFSYLKKYVNQYKNSYEVWHENCFWSLDKVQEIDDAEKRLGYTFPEILKTFWLNVGFGNLTTPDDKPKNYDCGCKNEFLRPKDIADILLLKEESGLILPWLLDYYNEGYLTNQDVPFFEVLTSDFLIMKPQSPRPNAVYNMIGEIIEEDFEKFIWRLYYESPTYYLQKIDK